jgi:hypothetical protein
MSEQPQEEVLPPDWNKDLPVITHLTKPSSEQPQEEWTTETVHKLFRQSWQAPELFKLIADAHNAAVAAAYEKGKQNGVREHYVGK